RNSFALKIWFALLIECTNPFFAIRSVNQVVVRFHLETKSSTQLHFAAVAHRLLDLSHRERSVACYALSRLESVGQYVVTQFVDEPPALSLFDGEWRTGHEDFLCTTLTHCTRKVLGAASSRHDPEGDFSQRHTKTSLRVDEIAGQGQLQATCISMTVDCRNDRQGKIQQRPVHALEQLVLTLPIRLRHAVTFLEIATRAKNAIATARHHDASNIAGVFGQIVPEAQQFLAHLRIDRISRGRTIQRHLQDMGTR